MESPTLDELTLLHANVCQALGDPKRILILYALHEQPRHVSLLADDLDMPQPTVSRHLAILRQRALVTTQREGTAVIYHLADSRIINILNNMRQVLRDAIAHQTTLLS
ncbi:MAG: winged helix-turn-helix transcriptional regulator [Ardenticatenaceae bacterium]|nr:winged helix-turn-helix transcriptional regulator [Ardenticatenaceae bacterium]